MPNAVKLVNSTDVLKQGWTVLGSVAKPQIKLNPSVLYGEGEVDVFARDLLDSFQRGVNELTDDLALEGVPGKRSARTDEELIALRVGFDDEFANTTAYVEALKGVFDGFKKYVRPIGETFDSDRLGNWRNTVRGVWMTGFGKKRLAVVQDRTIKSHHREDLSMSAGDRTPRRYFRYWVPPDMEAPVVNKTIREFGPLETIDSLTIKGTVSPPDTYRRDMKDDIHRHERGPEGGPRDA